MSEFEISDFESDVHEDEDIPIEAMKDRHLIAFGLYSKLKAYQYHYNNIKLKCKILCSTWILATFIAFGYLIAGEEVGLPFNTYFAISALCFLSSIGITLLWFLDIVVYNRILEVIFGENLALEKKYSFLTNTHHDMAKLLIMGTTGPVLYDSLYYSCFNFVLLVISDLTAYKQLVETDKKLAVIVAVVFSIFIILFQIYMFLIARGASLKRFHKKFKKQKSL